MLDFYECPTCGTENEDYVKYCKKCGTWLVANAKKVIRETNKKASKVLTAIVLVLVIVGGVTYYSKSSNITFPEMDVGTDYTVSQFVIQKSMLKSPTAMADILVHDDMKFPLDINAIFYDERDRRIARATSSILHQMKRGQTTTVKFTFDEGYSFANVASVRIEIIPNIPTRKY